MTVPLTRPRSALLAATLGAALLALALPAQAGTPAPVPAAPETASPTPHPAVTPTPPAAAASGEARDATPEPSAEPAAAARSGPSLTLQVLAVGSPAAGRFYQDIGRYGFRGRSSGLADGARVEVYRRSAGATTWTRVARTRAEDGRFSVDLPVTALGAKTFVATSGGAPGSGDEVRSPSVAVTVDDAVLTLDRPAARVDALAKPRLTGRVAPARAGVRVHLDVRRGSRWQQLGTATTDASGRYAVAFGYATGSLASYTVRAGYPAANRPRQETSPSRSLTRAAVLNAVVTRTTAADVAKTYRKGCPVGPSRLRTVRMNYYGRDKKMHRGVLIVRSDLVPEIERGFAKALAARYPIAKMRNPNDYGGNDPTQMAANNTSGFNCRKVVGNPYAQSPHSYGIALDVNTVQNPYRDATGRWWPANGRSYIKRTPLRAGMLSRSSALTRQLRADHFFWGGLWNPGRDYQHFEYRP